RQMMVNFREERGWGKYHTPRNLLLALVAEVGELSELFQWKGEVSNGLPDWSEKEKSDLGDELTDVLVYTVGLANACHVDLPAAVIKKMEQNAKKYPAERVFGSVKKYHAYEEWKQENSE
ncbi:hypothetical protein CAPTEDRAFT_93509, partial [Capitella teleta]